MPTFINAVCTLLLSTLGATAAAQSVRDAIASAQLGSGYAQILNFTATPDMSAATYVHTNLAIDVLRLPHEARWKELADDSTLYWRAAGGWLRMKEDFPVNVPGLGTGKITSRWSAYSLTGGVLVRIRLGQGFTLEPAIDAGVAQLVNQAEYSGVATLLQSSLNGLLFDWHTHAWLLTPNLALAWATESDSRRTSIRGHVATSRISSFGESDPILKFRETANVYSLRAEQAVPTGMQFQNHRLDWVLFGGYAGFFGANREALDFSSVAELGIALETPLEKGGEKAERVRLGASYLFGPDLRGWTVSFGVKY